MANAKESYEWARKWSLEARNAERLAERDVSLIREKIQKLEAELGDALTKANDARDEAFEAVEAFQAARNVFYAEDDKEPLGRVAIR